MGEILEADLSSPEVQRVAFKRYKPGWGQAPEGHIVLQSLGQEVSYRNIRVRKSMQIERHETWMVSAAKIFSTSVS